MRARDLTRIIWYKQNNLYMMGKIIIVKEQKNNN